MSAALLAPRITIAEMCEADVDQAAAIDVAAFPSPADGVEARAAHLREELARPWAHVWVARDLGGRVVAYALYWRVVDEVHVLNVATHPGERRRGFARSLMEHVLAISRGGGIRHVLLEVRRSNAAAIALYEGLGFFAVRVRARYYPDGEDAIEMELRMAGGERPAEREQKVETS